MTGGIGATQRKRWAASDGHTSARRRGASHAARSTPAQGNTPEVMTCVTSRRMPGVQTGKGLHGSLKKRLRAPVFQKRAGERSSFAPTGMEYRAWGLLHGRGGYIRVFGMRPVANRESTRSRWLNSGNAGDRWGRKDVCSTHGRHV